MTKYFSILLLVLTTVGCLSYHQGAMPGEPADATYAAVAGARVRYVDSGGDLPAVVLLHGFASALETWTLVAERLEATHRVIALDLKGFGWTDRPRGDYSPAAQAELVFALLDQLGVRNASIVAHSWGSSVALQMALSHPQRVTQLALYDAWVYEEQVPTGFVWARAAGVGELIFGMFYKERPDDKIEGAFHNPDYVTQALVDDVTAALKRPGTTAAALAAVRGQRYREVQQQYGSIAQPVLLIWGEDDAVSTLDVAHRLHTQLPNAQLETFADCGHFPMIEAFEPSTRVLLDFLAPSREVAP